MNEVQKKSEIANERVRVSWRAREVRSANMIVKLEGLGGERPETEGMRQCRSESEGGMWDRA